MDSRTVNLNVIFPAVILCNVVRVEAIYCIIVENGLTKQFACGPFQHCCGTSCCENFGFYRIGLCVLLAMIFCSFGCWYRRHCNHPRLMAPRGVSAHNTTMNMMFMMNNIQTNNHFDYRGGSDFYHPVMRCQRLPNPAAFARHHHQAPLFPGPAPYPESVCILSQSMHYEEPPPSVLSTPPPTYYETVTMPPPPDYAYFSSRACQGDPPPPHFEDLPCRLAS